MWITLLMFLFIAAFFLFSSMCSNKNGHDWELTDVYNGKLNHIKFYKCRHCHQERNESWYMKKIK